MPLLPYLKLELRTPLSAGEVLMAIASSVEPRRRFRFGAPGERPFEGTVADFAFDVQRIIAYRNSFLPQIHGTVTPDPPGTRISIKMQLHSIVAAFLTIWFTFVLVGVVVTMLGAFSGGIGSVATLIPSGMLLFGWVLTAGAFTFEARKAEKQLRDLLNAPSS